MNLQTMQRMEYFYIIAIKVAKKQNKSLHWCKKFTLLQYIFIFAKKLTWFHKGQARGGQVTGRYVVRSTYSTPAKQVVCRRAGERAAARPNGRGGPSPFWVRLAEWGLLSWAMRARPFWVAVGRLGPHILPRMTSIVILFPGFLLWQSVGPPSSERLWPQ